MTKDATEIDLATATLNGSLSTTNADDLTKEVWFLISDSASTLTGLKSSGTKVSATLKSDGNFSKGVTVATIGATYYYIACAKVYKREVYGEVKSFTTVTLDTPPGAVDMGTSVKWSSCNLGASSPEDYGDYYAWGETETKSDYSCSTYKFGTSGGGPFSKYNTDSTFGAVDNNTEMDPEDDVAHVNWGGVWRMPTMAEFAELLTNCKTSWTTLNGKCGRLFTSKINGNHIFLPAAGDWSDTSIRYEGSFGGYWSSSLDIDYPDRACGLYFDSSDVNTIIVTLGRCCGQTVRPVCK